MIHDLLTVLIFQQSVEGYHVLRRSFVHVLQSCHFYTIQILRTTCMHLLIYISINDLKYISYHSCNRHLIVREFHCTKPRCTK